VAQSRAPSSRFRLARGYTPPSSGFRLARGYTPPSSRFRLARGYTPPRAGSVSLEGTRPPRAGSVSLEGSPPPRSRLPHARTCSRTRVQAFNALTWQSRAIMRLGITPRRCSANSLGGTHPATMGDCATWPVSAPWHCAAHSCTASAPRPRTGPVAPSNPSLVNLQGQTVTSGRWERHPRPCRATPGTATTTPALLSTRGRDAATPATVPYTDRRQRLLRARLRTPQPTTMPSPSKPPLFNYGTRHDDKTGARAARMDANSPALHAIPPLVAKQCGMPVNRPLLGL
jgi:hypothetical protein